MRARRDFRSFLPPLSVLFQIASGLWLLASPTLIAQQVQDAPTQEFVANLAAGRVVIAVVKDAIVVATIENPIEVQTHVPTPVPVSSLRAEILLGAVDWLSPSSQIQIARIDQELPHLRASSSVAGPVTGPLPTTPSLNGVSANREATDLEGVGQALYERFNDVTKDIHGKISLPAGEPLAQLVIFGYAKDYGPEVWLLTFELKQDIQREDYFSTHVTRPRFFQYWPPEKGQPHTLVEFQYPPENPSPTILEMLKNRDPRLDKVISNDAKTQQVANLLVAGDSKKILGVDAVQFLRAVLGAIAPEKARETVSVLTEDGGLQWVLKPPAEAKAAPLPGEAERPPDAPSLLHPN
ncbi:MAG: hypothetical protein WA209_12880 [Candidatus Acidiferrales bacterium]